MSRDRRRLDDNKLVFKCRTDLVVCAIGASALYAALGLALLQLSGIGTNQTMSWGQYAFALAAGTLIWLFVTGAVTSFLVATRGESGRSRAQEFGQRLARGLFVGVLGAGVLYVLYNPAAFGPNAERIRVSTAGTITMCVGLVLQALLVYAGTYASAAKLGPVSATRASARLFLSWRGLRLALGVLLAVVTLNVILRFAVGERISDVAFSTIVLVGLGFAAVYVSGAVLTILRERRE